MSVFRYVDMMMKIISYELEMRYVILCGILAFHMYGNITSSRVWVHSNGKFTILGECVVSSKKN